MPIHGADRRLVTRIPQLVRRGPVTQRARAAILPRNGSAGTLPGCRAAALIRWPVRRSGRIFESFWRRCSRLRPLALLRRSSSTTASIFGAASSPFEPTSRIWPIATSTIAPRRCWCAVDRGRFASTQFPRRLHGPATRRVQEPRPALRAHDLVAAADGWRGASRGLLRAAPFRVAGHCRPRDSVLLQRRAGGVVLRLPSHLSAGTAGELHARIGVGPRRGNAGGLRLSVALRMQI